MKIAIIGAGNIGSTLGRKWASAGHEIRFGVRNPSDSKFDDLRSDGHVVPIAEALLDAEIVLLSLPGQAVAEFVTQYAADLSGKIIIDATNVVSTPVMNNLSVIKEKVPNSSLVRAFSTLGWENFAKPRIAGDTIDLFFCAEAHARSQAEQLISQIGLRPIYLGDLDTVELVDSLTRLWFTIAFSQGRGRRIAFKLLHE